MARYTPGPMDLAREFSKQHKIVTFLHEEGRKDTWVLNRSTGYAETGDDVRRLTTKEISHLLWLFLDEKANTRQHSHAGIHDPRNSSRRIDPDQYMVNEVLEALRAIWYRGDEGVR